MATDGLTPYERQMRRAEVAVQQGNCFLFRSKIAEAESRNFLVAAHHFARTRPRIITLDFSKVVSAFPNGMVPLICTVDALRRIRIEVEIILPKASQARYLFINTNWAHLLCPEKFGCSTSDPDTRVCATRFVTPTQQCALVNQCVEVIMRNIQVSRSELSGLEWSLNEITDNVLNHAECPDGGIAQVTPFPANGSVAFAIGDSGIGITSSLRQGIPTLRNDKQALGEAVKAGVTRSSSAGQGNGLAGTLRISTGSGGRFSLSSGRGHLGVFGDDTDEDLLEPFFRYPGTLVCAEMQTQSGFSISEALSFGKTPHTPVDAIEVNYEKADGQAYQLHLADETTGFGNRSSGAQLRNKCMNLLQMDLTMPIELEWEGIPAISSSFADEFLGKLFIDIGPLAFSARIRNMGMESLVASLIDKAITQRLTQATDED